MRRITTILIFLVCLGLLPVAPVMAGLFSNDTLVSIDESSYSMDDFKRWWKFWKEEEEKLPETPEPYTNWLLLGREAERMAMDQTPGFKRQTRVFLQSRTLLMLKYDEVDSKINVTDADIKARYEKEFLPRWQIQRLEFKNEGLAIAAWEKLKNKSLTLGDLIERDPEQDGPIDVIENWVRPKQIDTGWATIFKKLTVGEVVDPNEHGKGRILYVLKEQKGGDDEDLERFREGLEKTLWKEQEDLLTKALIDKLRDKYQIKIDEERLAALDINAADDTLTDASIITSTKENVSEKQFIAVIRRLMKSRPAAAHAASGDEELASSYKKETVNNIIYQAVTNWESLDRHYEEKEPFKWEYEFNFKHRLTQALERQIFGPEAKVSEEEIKEHYKNNLIRYTQPTMVNLYIIHENQAPIDLIWADVAVGKNFQHILKEHSEQPIKPKEAPANHLDPEVKEVVAKLVDGETSQIFTAQGVRVLVHLLERTPEAPLPLERVKESIRSYLWKKELYQVRNTYLDKIKAGSKIEVRERNWEKIQKELGGV
ncbi:peptidyl-prolyl cis-trans isomerase [Thermodesulfobacteriota bacterium]